MTKAEGEDFYRKYGDEIDLIAKKAFRKHRGRIEKIHGWEDLRQEMWAHAMTLPSELTDDHIIQYSLRAGLIALRPPRTNIESRYVYEDPTDPDVLVDVIEGRRAVDWENWVVFNLHLEELLDDFEFDVYKMLLKRRIANRKMYHRKAEARRRRYGKAEGESSGYTMEDIANALGVHRNTVTNTRNRIKRIMETEMRDHEVVQYALRLMNHE